MTLIPTPALPPKPAWGAKVLLPRREPACRRGRLNLTMLDSIIN